MTYRYRVKVTGQVVSHHHTLTAASAAARVQAQRRQAWGLTPVYVQYRELTTWVPEERWYS